MKKKEESDKRERKKERKKCLSGHCYCNPPNFNSDFGGEKVRTKTKNLACG
jgi:hypothetical protein